MRRPGEGLDCGLMLVESYLGLIGVPCRPDQEFIIITARSELLFVKAPLEPAYFLPVADEFGLVAGGGPHVAVEDVSVPASRGEHAGGPRDSTDAALVTTEGSNNLILLYVPDL